MISIFECLCFSSLIIFISLLGIVINKNNIILVLLCIELLLLGVSTSFVAFSYARGDAMGQIFVFFILTISAVEASVGLAILVTIFRKNIMSSLYSLSELKG